MVSRFDDITLDDWNEVVDRIHEVDVVYNKTLVVTKAYETDSEIILRERTVQRAHPRITWSRFCTPLHR